MLCCSAHGRRTEVGGTSLGGRLRRFPCGRAGAQVQVGGGVQGTVVAIPYATRTIADELPAELRGPGADARIAQAEEQRCAKEITWESVTWWRWWCWVRGVVESVDDGCVAVQSGGGGGGGAGSQGKGGASPRHAGAAGGVAGPARGRVQASSCVIVSSLIILARSRCPCESTPLGAESSPSPQKQKPSSSSDASPSLYPRGEDRRRGSREKWRGGRAGGARPQRR